MAGGGRADEWLDQPRRRAAFRFSPAAEDRWRAGTGRRAWEQGRESLRRDAQLICEHPREPAHYRGDTIGVAMAAAGEDSSGRPPAHHTAARPPSTNRLTPLM